MRLYPLLAATLVVGALAVGCTQPSEAPTMEVSEITTEPMVDPTEAPTEAPTEEAMAEPTQPLDDQGRPNAAPAVQLVPLQNPDQITVGQEAGVAVIAADSHGLSKAELVVDGQVVSSLDIASETLFQGTLKWTPTTPGVHNGTVLVYDAHGAVSQAVSATVTVHGLNTPVPTAAPAPTAVAQSAPPAVSITPDPMELPPGSKLDVYTNAVDQTGVVKLELYVDGKVIDSWTFDGAAADAPKSSFETLTWREAKEGQHEVFVRATNTTGTVGQSVTEKVKVRNP